MLVGLDPSFRRTGISIFTGDKIIVDECKLEANKDKSFEQIVKDAERQTHQIINKILSICCDSSIKVITECPPPQGMFSPGLYALDTLLVYRLSKYTKTIYRVYPTYIQHVHGKRKFNKSESVELAKEILSKYDYDIRSKRLSHDESESVIFLSRLMCREGYLEEELCSKYSGLTHEMEKLIEL